MKKLAYIQAPFANTPDFQALGFEHLTLLTSWAFFKGQDRHRIDMATVMQAASHPTWWNGKETLPIVFDIETMALATHDEPRRDHEHDQLLEVVEYYRSHPKHHHKALGFYGEMPQRDFFRALGHQGPERFAEWKKENRFFLFNLHDTTLERQRGLSAYVDRIYPSLYYWYPQRIGEFATYADLQLHEASIYNKPIIAYVNPQVQTTGFPFWEPGVWRDMLGYVLNHPLVDGVVIYMDKTGDGKWNPDWPWWKETLEVINA